MKRYRVLIEDKDVGTVREWPEVYGEFEGDHVSRHIRFTGDAEEDLGGVYLYLTASNDE